MGARRHIATIRMITTCRHAFTLLILSRLAVSVRGRCYRREPSTGIKRGPPTLMTQGSTPRRAPTTIGLWRHNSGGHELVGARVEEQQAADVYRAAISDRRHAAQFRARLLKYGYCGCTRERCKC